VREADRELARMRRAAITPTIVPPPAPVGVVQGGIFAGMPGVVPAVPTEPLDGDSTRLERRSEVADEILTGEPPLGWYEPHTGVWHCTFEVPFSSPQLTGVCFPDRADSQPTRAKLTLAPPTREAILADGVLGGAKIGSNAWGIASVKTFMELPEREEKPPGEFVWEG
jgi:hypothetical protein